MLFQKLSEPIVHTYIIISWFERGDVIIDLLLAPQNWHKSISHNFGSFINCLNKPLKWVGTALVLNVSCDDTCIQETCVIMCSRVVWTSNKFNLFEIYEPVYCVTSYFEFRKLSLNLVDIFKVTLDVGTVPDVRNF